MTQEINGKRVVKLQATIHATQRTRNRIKENGPSFLLITPENTSGVHPKPGWTMFQSLTTDWWGWLPIGEFREL
jgi:hypothetical protein